MQTVRLALAQVNPTVGDIAGNVALCRRAVAAAAGAGAQIVLLPEMVLTGYPIEDLALRPSFQTASEAAIGELARGISVDGHGDLVVIAGYLKGTDRSEAVRQGVPRGAPRNCAAVLHRGQVVASYAKHHLPNFGVFDEYRYFVPGTEPLIVSAFGVDIAVVVCEDLWQEGGPVAAVRGKNVGILAVLNGSPYEREKDDVRTALVTLRAKETGAVVAYVNMVGAQDELVFDGDSVVIDPDGAVLGRAPQFEEHMLVVDVSCSSSAGAATVVLDTTDRPLPYRAPEPPAPRLDDHAQVYAALVSGLRDYVAKNGFRSVILGLSGGIDSALVATIAVDALGADRVYGVMMPSQYSSQHSKDDAADLAGRLGLHVRTEPITYMVNTFINELGFTGLAEENLQARVRGVTLMGISNQEGHLVLATGNKSELAVGYSTIYGDAVGGFAPIKDVYKIDVWALARWRNAQATGRDEVEPIPQSSIDKAPSAELRPGQLDTDSLPDYELLDAILRLYIEQDMSLPAIVARGFDSATVARVVSMTDSAEYKRRQYPPGTKVSSKAFGRDRRLPMTSKWHEPPAGA